MSINPPLPSPYAPPQIPPQKTWLGRNWIWVLILAAILIVGAVCGMVFTLFTALSHSEVVRGTFQRAESNPVLIERLGTPMKEGWLVSGSINVTPTSGDADLAVPISGPKGTATVYVTAHKSLGIWKYTAMQAAVAGHSQRIDLLSTGSVSY